MIGAKPAVRFHRKHTVVDEYVCSPVQTALKIKQVIQRLHTGIPTNSTRIMYVTINSPSLLHKAM